VPDCVAEGRPSSVTEGALDWMGLAHMIGQPGAAEMLAGAGPRVPMLEPEQITLFAWAPSSRRRLSATPSQRQKVATIPVERVASDPRGAAAEAQSTLEARCDCLLVHFDGDVIGFTAAPLSENWGRNEGLSFRDAIRIDPGRRRRSGSDGSCLSCGGPPA
jgi:arginase